MEEMDWWPCYTKIRYVFDDDLAVVGVSTRVRHKPGCTATEDVQRLEILDLENRGIVLHMKRKQRR